MEKDDPARRHKTNHRLAKVTFVLQGACTFFAVSCMVNQLLHHGEFVVSRATPLAVVPALLVAVCIVLVDRGAFYDVGSPEGRASRAWRVVILLSFASALALPAALAFGREEVLARFEEERRLQHGVAANGVIRRLERDGAAVEAELAALANEGPPKLPDTTNVAARSLASAAAAESLRRAQEEVARAKAVVERASRVPEGGGDAATRSDLPAARRRLQVGETALTLARTNAGLAEDLKKLDQGLLVESVKHDATDRADTRKARRSRLEAARERAKSDIGRVTEHVRRIVLGAAGERVETCLSFTGECLTFVVRGEAPPLASQFRILLELTRGQAVAAPTSADHETLLALEERFPELPRVHPGPEATERLKRDALGHILLHVCALVLSAFIDGVGLLARSALTQSRKLLDPRNALLPPEANLELVSEETRREAVRSHDEAILGTVSRRAGDPLEHLLERFARAGRPSESSGATEKSGPRPLGRLG